MISDLVSSWPSEYSFSLCLILGTALIAALIPTSIVASVQWRKVREAELVYHLKQEMLARGMTVAEIERVMLLGQDRTTC